MLRFWYGSGSPFAWRVQLALEEKGLAYEPILLSFERGEHKRSEHLARHPHGKVPALADGDLVLYESGAILEYLEEKYPTPPLLPTDPVARALVRIEELEATIYCSAAFQDVARQLFFTPPDRRDEGVLAQARAVTRKEIERFEARAARRGQPFVYGPTLTRADLTWLPFVELVGRAGIAIEAADLPWVGRWLAAMRTRPSYERSYPPHWRKS